MNLKLNFNGKTLLKNWWRMVLENFTLINTNFEKHRTQLSMDHPNKSVKKTHLADNSVGTEQIEDYSVTQAKLAQYSVSSAKIYPAAVQTAHIKDQNVTRAKLEQDLQDQLETFQTHMDNPSQEIPIGSVSWDKIAPEIYSVIRNYMNDRETYAYCANNFAQVYGGALFLVFNSGLGDLVGAPPDNTAADDGNVKYVLFNLSIANYTRLQIAMNVGSFKKYRRVTDSVFAGEWHEIT